MDKPYKQLLKALNNKVSDSPKRSFFLGVWAGIYIAIGGTFYGIISNFSGQENLIRLLAALSFTIGLNLVVFKKAQLFTGNNLMLVELFKKSISFTALLKNWVFVYLGNLVGSLIIVSLVTLLIFKFDPLTEHLKNIALKKSSYNLNTAFIKAIYCNILVCIAIWFGVTANSIPKKVTGIIIPITLFVYLGFEHSIANMFFIPLGLSFSQVSLSESIRFFMQNIVPVTVGNIVGGMIVSLLIIGYYRKSH
ncbi:MAG: formate/nitrite transporter family protein [Bacteriovoracaceae bacterium]